MKKIFLYMTIALAAVSCAREMPGKEECAVDQVRVPLTFRADVVATRTSLGSDWSVSWCEGDQVKILWVGGETVTEASLEGGKAYFSAAVDEVQEYYAVYPASIEASVGVDGKLSLVLPSSQTGRFEDCAVIVAHTTRESLDFGKFKSAAGLIRFAIADPAVTRVRFCGAGEEPVGGTVVADASLSCETVPGSTAVDVAVAGAGTYYMSVLPGVQLTSGICFQLGTDEKWLGTASSPTPATIQAGQVLLVTASLEDKLVVEGDIYITEPEALRSLLSNPASASKLDGHTVHVSAETYDLAVGETGLSLNFESATTVKIIAEEGTVFTTSLTGAEGCILTVASANVNLDIEGVTFSGGSHEGTGGALCLTKGSHSFKHCIFSNNQTTSATNEKTGGAVYVGGDASAAFESCKFTGNKTAITGGGALAVYTSAKVTVLDCDFTGNISHTGAAYVGNGGAILQKKAGNVLYIVNCRFSGNGTATNGPDLFSSAGAALFLYNSTFAHPLNPDAKSANRGSARSNVPSFVANCTFVVEVDEKEAGAGTSNGLMAFGQSNNNEFVGNLMLSNAGYSFGVGAKYTSTTTKQATTKGHNVYSEAPKIVLTDGGNNTDLTGIRTADVVSSTVLASDGLLHWDGPAAKFSGYQAATAERMASVIKAYPDVGNDFYNWLVAKGVFGKDAAGTDRGDSWWPGAYQGL
ncbi:MAG: right-handed parallel beta-helix repeat-containing protein [Bacteroidales bacterium]|nr:right-handed parallel beta-helix repeat-containing protein [Bacteroidales bacterium]